MKYQDIELLIDYLNDKPPFTYVNQFDLKKLYIICKSHQLTSILYEAIKKYHIEIDEKILKSLEKEYNELYIKSIVQEAELESIINELTKNKIWVMPLKGSVLKALYPKINLRSMADLDILFDKTKTKEVHHILKGLGYKNITKGGNHDVFYKLPFMNIEMHRGLIADSYFNLAPYYKDFKPLLKPTTIPYIYKMSNEDFYIFMITHIAKHYSNGGIGIRYVFDEFVYLKAYGNSLDYSYINKELEKLGLTRFEENFRNLTTTWFTGKEATPFQEEMTKYIFKSHVHGTLEHEMLVGSDTSSNYTNKNSKLRFYLSNLFPSFSIMKERNQILKKIPILLPFFYIERILLGIFCRKKFIKAKVDSFNKISEEEIFRIKKFHEQSGI